MSTTICPEIHKYVIADSRGNISEIFYSIEEAEAHRLSISALLTPFWVAFHEVPIQQLLDHPDTIQSYCAGETRRVENPKVDFFKRS